MYTFYVSRKNTPVGKLFFFSRILSFFTDSGEEEKGGPTELKQTPLFPWFS